MEISAVLYATKIKMSFFIIADTCTVVVLKTGSLCSFT
jgi:hypothetical protein